MRFILFLVLIFSTFLVNVSIEVVTSKTTVDPVRWVWDPETNSWINEGGSMNGGNDYDHETSDPLEEKSSTMSLIENVIMDILNGKNSACVLKENNITTAFDENNSTTNFDEINNTTTPSFELLKNETILDAKTIAALLGEYNSTIDLDDNSNTTLSFLLPTKTSLDENNNTTISGENNDTTASGVLYTKIYATSPKV